MMFCIFSFNRFILNAQLSCFVKTIFQRSATRSIDGKSNESPENRERSSITKKMRLLGLQSSQARQALSIYDDYVHRQKKVPDLRMFAVAINCAMLAEDLAKGREIHQFIERQFPHLKDNLMLKQQLRYFYLKLNDHASAEKLFQQSASSQHSQSETLPDSNQSDKHKK